MKVNFCDLEKSLDIRNLSKFKIISIEDFGKYYQNNIDFPSGAHQIEVILARIDDFKSISDFLIHVRSIGYANRVSFNFTTDFFDQSFLLTEMDSDQFALYLDSYFEGFFEHLSPISPDLTMWKVQLKAKNYLEGYKIELPGTAQILICRTASYYMYFTFQSID